MAYINEGNSPAGVPSKFFSEGEVCKYGHLIKSPPLPLFSSQNSWKKRFFILFKSRKGNYILKYLKDKNVKGSIEINQIVKIQVGIKNAEMMEAVRKMFNCLPEEVISIKTGSRHYFLIGSSRQETEEWFTVISSVCKEAKTGEVCPQNQDLPNPQVRSRLSSLPIGLNSIDMTSFLEKQRHQKENGSSEDKGRRNSDPGPHQAQCDSPGEVFPSVSKHQRRGEANLLSADKDEDQDIKKAKEVYYQSPRNLLAKCFQQCSTEVPTLNPTAGSEVPVKEKPVQNNRAKENIYMLMKPLRQRCIPGEASTAVANSRHSVYLASNLLDRSGHLTGRSDGLPPLPKRQDNSMHPRGLGANRGPEDSTRQQPDNQTTQKSNLSVIQLSKLLSQVTDETQLQKLDISVSLDDINSYLKLTKAAGRICVSSWTGPSRLGCLFNHGDHIVAVNDLQPQDVEEAYCFISRSAKKEVKLTVCRIPHSDVFHVKECSCS